MSLIAGQTAGPNGLKFLVDSHGWQRGVLGEKKIRNCFFQIFFLIIKKNSNLFSTAKFSMSTFFE